MQPGQHNLQLTRNDIRSEDERYSNNRGKGRNKRSNDGSYNNISTFYVRQGYDLEITVNNNGSLVLKELKIKNNHRGGNNDQGSYNNQNRYAMNDASFNELYKGMREQWFNGARINAINATFSNNNYFFSAYQAKQLIQLVTGENERLGLAKASFRTVVDIVNISTFNDLFTMASSREELLAHSRNYRLKP